MAGDVRSTATRASLRWLSGPPGVQMQRPAASPAQSCSRTACRLYDLPGKGAQSLSEDSQSERSSPRKKGMVRRPFARKLSSFGTMLVQGSSGRQEAALTPCYSEDRSRKAIHENSATTEAAANFGLQMRTDHARHDKVTREEPAPAARGGRSAAERHGAGAPDAATRMKRSHASPQPAPTPAAEAEQDGHRGAPQLLHPASASAGGLVALLWACGAERELELPLAPWLAARPMGSRHLRSNSVPVRSPQPNRPMGMSEGGVVSSVRSHVCKRFMCMSFVPAVGLSE